MQPRLIRMLHGWYRRSIPPVTPLRVDRYRFTSHRPIEELLLRVPPIEKGDDLRRTEEDVDVSDGVLSLRVTHGTGERWRFPEQIARVAFIKSDMNIVVEVSIRLDSWAYLFGYGWVLVGMLFLYGALFENFYTALAMYGIGLFFFHLQILVFPQCPDRLAESLVRQFDLSPGEVTSARVGRGSVGEHVTHMAQPR